MARYHIGQRGGIAVCQAQPGNCPLGDQHFASKAVAQFYLEAQQLPANDHEHTAVPRGYTAKRVTAQSLTPGSIIQFDDFGAFTPPHEVVKVEQRSSGTRLHTRFVAGGVSGGVIASTHHPRTPIRQLTPVGKTRMSRAQHAALKDATDVAADEWSRFRPAAMPQLSQAVDALRRGSLGRQDIEVLIEASEVALDGERRDDPELASVQQLLRSL